MEIRNRLSQCRARAGAANLVAVAAFAVLANTASAQPSNDNRASAFALSGPAVTSNGSNLDATTEPGELLSCNPLPGPGIPGFTRYDSTVWFTYDPPMPGTVVATAAPGVEQGGQGNGDGVSDMVLSVYNPAGNFLGCVDHDDPTVAEGALFFIAGAGDPGPMPIQIGGYDNGVDFEQGTYTLTISFSRAPRVGSSLKYGFERFRKFTVLKRLKVNSEPGTTTTITCRGRGCPIRQPKQFGLANVNASKVFKKAHLKRGAKVDVFVTKPESFGSFTELKFRPPGPPKKKVACIAAGDTTPTIQEVVPCQ